MNAIEFLNGFILPENGGVVYYDNSTLKHYLSPTADLPHLEGLLESDSTTAYSLWCADTIHDEYSPCFP